MPQVFPVMVLFWMVMLPNIIPPFKVPLNDLLARLMTIVPAESSKL
jgi:uncharacterized protein YhhL (DUF1145 family)